MAKKRTRGISRRDDDSVVFTPQFYAALYDTVLATRGAARSARETLLQVASSAPGRPADVVFTAEMMGNTVAMLESMLRQFPEPTVEGPLAAGRGHH